MKLVVKCYSHSHRLKANEAKPAEVKGGASWLCIDLGLAVVGLVAPAYENLKCKEKSKQPVFLSKLPAPPPSLAEYLIDTILKRIAKDISFCERPLSCLSIPLRF